MIETQGRWKGLEALRSPQVVGLLLGLVGTLCLSLKSVVVKLAYAAGSDAQSLLAQRMAIALPVYGAIWIGVRACRRMSWGDIARSSAIGVLGYGVSSYLDLRGLEYLSASVERLILYSYPAFTALLGYVLLAQRVSSRAMGGIALSYAGLAVVLVEHVGGEDRASLTGCVLVLASAVTFALSQLYTGPLVRRVGTLPFTCAAMAAASAASIVSAMLQRPFADLVPNAHIGMLAVVLAFVGTILPSFTIAAALKRISAQSSAAIGSLSPALTAVIAALVLGEVMSPTAVVGAAVMVLGTLWGAFPARTGTRR